MKARELRQDQRAKREHRRRSCESKVRHPDLIAALVKAVHQMEETPGLKLDTYKCQYCHGYHLCRTKGNAQRARHRLFRARPKGGA